MKRTIFKTMYSSVNIFFITMLIVVAFCMSSCGGSPEDTGKNLSDKECDCDNTRIKDNHEKMIEFDKQVLDALKDGDIKSRIQYNTKRDEIRKKVYGDGTNKSLEDCQEELKQLGKDADLKFSRQDDRQTIQNAYEANHRVCKDEQTEMYKKNNEEEDKLEKKIQEQEQKLP